jgi:hypothetical protein
VVIEVSGCSYCQEFEGTYASNQATGAAPVPSFVRVHRPAPRRGYYLGTPEALLTSRKEEPRGCVSNPAPITTSELAQTRQNSPKLDTPTAPASPLRRSLTLHAALPR